MERQKSFRNGIMEEQFSFRSRPVERRHSFKHVEMEKHPSFKIGLMEKQRSFRYPSSADRQQQTFLRPPSTDKHQTTSLPVKKNTNNRGSKRGDTDLHIAARIHDVSKLQELLHRNDEDILRQMVSRQNQIGETCLYVASENGHADVVREILIHSDYQSAALKANNGFDSFQIAARQGHLGVLKELLHSFPELAMTTNSVNSTALDTAATQGHIEIVDLLLESNIPDLAKIARSNGKTALHSAARGGHVEIVRSLLAKDPTIVYRCDRKGQTAFHMAVKGTSADVFWELLKPHPPSIINLEDNKGNTGLHIATRKERPQVVRNLVSVESVEINRINKGFETALDIATKLNHEEIINILKDAGGLVAKEHANPPTSPAKQLKKTVSDIKHDVQSQLQQTRKTGHHVHKIKKKMKKLHIVGLNNAMSSNTIVAVLIATIAFAAIFTLPAQNVQEITNDTAGYTLGQAYIATNAPFVVFFVFDSLSLFISLSVVVVQTSLIVTEEKAKALMVFVINKLMWLACVFMSVAFISLTFIVVGRHSRWLAWATAGIGTLIMLITIGLMCYCIVRHRISQNSKIMTRPTSRSLSPPSLSGNVESDSELMGGKLYAL